MAEVFFGEDALARGAESNEGGGGGAEFTSFKSGTLKKVKAANMSKTGGYIPATMAYFAYGSFKPQVNTFVAKEPSKKSKKGYPVENLTPWDLAWKFHADKSEKFQDAHSQEAYKYLPKLKYATAFIDLETGEPIFVEFTKKQFDDDIKPVLTRYAKKLDTMAFELSKDGKSTSTKVSLSPIIDVEEDLSADEQKHLKESESILEPSHFEGLLYERDEKEMIQGLMVMGFDVTKIGLTPVTSEDEGAQEAAEEAANQIPEETDDEGHGF